METETEYINRIYNEARMQSLCKTQGEFADLLGMNQSTISNALRGNRKYLTPNLIRRIKIWEKQVLNPSAAPKPAQPDITIPAATAAFYENLSATSKSQAETIRSQAEIIKAQLELISRLQGGAPRPGTYTAPKNWQTDKP